MLKSLLGINFGVIPIYYFMMLFGFYLAYNKLDVLLKREAYSRFMKKKIKSSFFIGAIVGLLVANIVNWFLFDELLQRSLIIRFTQGGFSYIFGLIVFLLCSFLLLKVRRVETKRAMNLVVEPILIAHFWGRIGCSLRGCCWGETILIDGIEVMIPVREIEALCLLGLYWLFSRKIKEQQLWIYLLSYSGIRFVLEFFRGDDRGCLFGITILSPTQITCIFIVGISSFVLFVKPRLDWEQIKLKFGNVNIPSLFKEALPMDYDEIPGKNIAQRIIIPIICASIIAFVLFVGINPIQLNWCNALQWKAEEMFSVFAAEKNVEESVGDSTGTSIIPIDAAGPVDLDGGLEIISQVDQWTNAIYVPIDEEKLENGDKAYYYLQSVNNRPVLGTTRTLVVDTDANPEYVVADASSQAYTTTIREHYVSSGVTLESLFGQDVRITDFIYCWYDTGEGLIAVKHVLFSCGEEEPVMGAVLQETNEEIVCFTGTELGVLTNFEKMKMLWDTNVLINQIQLQKMAKGGSWVDLFNKQTRNEINEAINEIIEAHEISQQQAGNIVLSVNQIISKNTNANMQIYGELFEIETRKELLKDGRNEAEVETICADIRRYFDASDEDEKSVKIVAGAKENKFKHKIHYYLDADIFNIVGEEDHSLEISIETDSAIKLELYDENGRAITSTFVEEKESIRLYPEDGTNFVLKIKGDKSDTTSGGDYTISVKKSEEESEAPLLVQTTMYRVEKAYNESNMVEFMSVFLLEDYSLVEGMALGALAPIVDSCAANLDEIGEVDTTKNTIVQLLLKDRNTADFGAHLPNSELRITYIEHQETDEGYLVKSRVVITKEETLIFSGIIRFRLAPVEVNDLPEEVLNNEIAKILNENNYCITEVNTIELYDVFGDDPSNPDDASDIKSLYEFIIETTDTVDDITIRQKEFDFAAAKVEGHSDEKLDYMEQYVIRLNISYYKQVIKDLQNRININESKKIGYEMVKFAMDADGYMLEYVADKNVVTSVIYDLYELKKNPLEKITGDFEDAIEEAIVGEVFEEIDEETEKMKKTIAKIERKMERIKN